MRRCRRRLRLRWQRARFEFCDRQGSVVQILPGHKTDLLGRYRLKFFEDPALVPIGNAGCFELADFHRLGKKRIPFVNLVSDPLRLCPCQFFFGDPVADDPGDFMPESGFEFAP